MILISDRDRYERKIPIKIMVADLPSSSLLKHTFATAAS